MMSHYKNESYLPESEIRVKVSNEKHVYVVFNVDTIDPHKFYSNVCAFDKVTGDYLWTLEEHIDKREASKNGEFSSLGPVENLIIEDDYLVLFKAHGWKIAVNPENGVVLKDIDLNIKGGRPW